jgi:hypothetical protein
LKIGHELVGAKVRGRAKIGGWECPVEGLSVARKQMATTATTTKHGGLHGELAATRKESEGVEVGNSNG